MHDEHVDHVLQVDLGRPRLQTLQELAEHGFAPKLERNQVETHCSLTSSVGSDSVWKRPSRISGRKGRRFSRGTEASEESCKDCRESPSKPHPSDEKPPNTRMFRVNSLAKKNHQLGGVERLRQGDDVLEQFVQQFRPAAHVLVDVGRQLGNDILRSCHHLTLESVSKSAAKCTSDASRVTLMML